MIPVAHDSAGPKLDIVKPGMGFLAHDFESYAVAIHCIFSMSLPNDIQMRQRAREHARKHFSEIVFADAFLYALNVGLSPPSKDD